MSGSTNARVALVTGANGYLGSRFASHAEACGWKAERCARRPTGPGWHALPSLDSHDIARLPLDCDAVVHFAAIAHRYPPNAPSESEYERVNAHGTAALARAARGRARTFVLVSSVAAVGGTGSEPIGPRSEARPESPYGRSKLLAERLAAEALSGSETSLRIVRLPAVYGPGAPGAVAQLGRWVARGFPVPSCCASARRSMIAVDNALDALLVAAHHPALGGQIVMPSDGPAPDMLDLARRIARAQGRSIRILPCPRLGIRALSALAAAVGRGRGAMGTAAARLLEQCIVEDDTMQRLSGWQPPRSLEEGLARSFGAAP